MGTHGFLSVISINNQNLAQRAAASGVNNFTGGNVLGGRVDAFDFFRLMVETSSMRNDIMNASSTIFGAGFSTSAIPGQHATYFTYMLGMGGQNATNLEIRAFNTPITNSPLNMASTRNLVMGINETITISAIPTPAGADVRWDIISGNVQSISTSGNTLNISAPNTTGTITLTATVQSGHMTQIVHTVTIQVVAVHVILSPPVITAGVNQSIAQVTIAPIGVTDLPTMVWQSANPAIANVAQNGIVTGVTGGSTTITALLSWNTNTHLGQATGAGQIVVSPS